MQKILRKYRSLKNKKRNRRSRLLFDSCFHKEYFKIPEYTMSMIESSMENFKRGIVYGPIDLSEFAGILKGKVPDDIDRHSLREERINDKFRN